ncbi:Crp/Fnr family transcriptional regulator [Listeria monocytogenes]|nr:Crp/Fnr family transcriptional regulator [Listeria monocytogenes]MCV12357.1 Crp/Fnr family transcriptional regulator [Listeria monocytogenes]
MDYIKLRVTNSMKNDFSKILKTSSLCQDLTDEQINRLIKSGLIKFVQYKRNEILFWTDKTPDKLVILLSGIIAMGRDTYDGKRSLSKSNTSVGELIGEVRLFSPKKLLWEYAVALEDVEVLEISSSLILKSTAEYADIQLILMRNVMSVFVRKIDYLGDQVRTLSYASARDRIVFYLFGRKNKKNQIILTETREEIADYLGIARPSLSREFGRMKSEGLIRVNGHEVVVVDQTLFDHLFN